MTWSVELHDDFAEEFKTLPEEVKVEMLAQAKFLEEFGPQLGRPSVDQLNGSKFANMKELRFSVERAPWRVAFAFDKKQKAILLVGGSKAGMKSHLFYRKLIKTADQRFAKHIGLGY